MFVIYFHILQPISPKFDTLIAYVNFFFRTLAPLVKRKYPKNSLENLFSPHISLIFQAIFCKLDTIITYDTTTVKIVFLMCVCMQYVNLLLILEIYFSVTFINLKFKFIFNFYIIVIINIINYFTLLF